MHTVIASITIVITTIKTFLLLYKRIIDRNYLKSENNFVCRQSEESRFPSTLRDAEFILTKEGLLRVTQEN